MHDPARWCSCRMYKAATKKFFEAPLMMCSSYISSQSLITGPRKLS